MSPDHGRDPARSAANRRLQSRLQPFPKTTTGDELSPKRLPCLSAAIVTAGRSSNGGWMAVPRRRAPLSGWVDKSARRSPRAAGRSPMRPVYSGSPGPGWSSCVDGCPGCAGFLTVTCFDAAALRVLLGSVPQVSVAETLMRKW